MTPLGGPSGETFSDDDVVGMMHLAAQAETMAAKGIGSFAGLHRSRQARVELVGGGGDGTMLNIGYHAALADRFVATGQYDDGSGVEKAAYVKRYRKDHPEAIGVVYYLYDGVPE